VFAFIDSYVGMQEDGTSEMKAKAGGMSKGGEAEIDRWSSPGEPPPPNGPGGRCVWKSELNVGR